METLFELEDQYKNSLKDFNMTVDYQLAYLTTDGQSVPALTGVANVGSAMYDPNGLPALPPNFRCYQLSTQVMCDFYKVDQNEREIYGNTAANQKILAQKKKITDQQRAFRVQTKVADKLQALANRFQQ